MLSVENPSQRLRDSVTLVSALLLVHIFLIVNGGLFADDWLLFAIKSGYPVQTDFLIHGAGHPFLFLYVTLANLSGHPVACMKILALAGIVIGALNLRSFLLRLSVFSEFEAVTFSFLVWSYGGYQNWATKLLATYVFSFGLLCLGLNLLSIVASSDRPNIWLRLSSLAALFCSFSLNSMIAAYGIGLGAIFLAQAYREQAERQGILSRIAAMCRRFPDFLILPVIYWVSVNHFFPKIGPYENYYRPRIRRHERTSVRSRSGAGGRFGVYRPGFPPARPPPGNPYQGRGVAGACRHRELCHLCIALSGFRPTASESFF